MHLSVVELGALFLVLYVLFHWLGILVTTRAVMALLGTVTLGTQGFLGRILGDIGAWLERVGTSVTAWAFGVGIAAVPFLIAVVILIHDLHPKKQASKRTGYVAVLVGVSLASAIAVIPALAPVRSAIYSLMGSIVSLINSL